MDVARARGSRWASQVGGALVQTVVVLLVLAVAGYELIAIGVTSFAVDDASRQVARAARDAYRSSDGSLDATAQAAVTAAETHRSQVTDVSIDGEVLTVTLNRRATTLLVHRFAATEQLGAREATGRAPLDVR